MASLLDRAKALYGGDSPVSMFNIPERFTKVDDRGLPSDPLNRNLGTTIHNDPIIQGISGAVDTLNANQAAGFQDWLKTPAGRMWETSQSQGALRRATPSTPLGDSFLDPEVDEANDAAKDALRKAQENIAKEARERPPTVPTGTEKTEDLTEEAKTFNTAATVVSPSAPEKKQDWFNAINDRIDLMAMGAAMLAGSGQRGATTMSRLGEGLQAGLASRAAQAKEAENKQYRDAVLLLQAQKARAAGITDPFKNYGSKISDLSASLVGLGVPQDEAKAQAEVIYANTNGRIMEADANERNKLLRDIIKGSTGMFDIGSPDVDLNKIVPALANLTTSNRAN